MTNESNSDNKRCRLYHRYFYRGYPLKITADLGFLSVKDGGCTNGECGACTILMDSKPINACTIFTVQAEGHNITTVESMGENPNQGWKKSAGLHLIQRAFVESGAI